MKNILIALVATMVFSNTYAMRCGSHLINEGDNVARLTALCGEPTAGTFANLVYINKDGDNMDYYIHVDSNGVIDNIAFSRTQGSYN